MTSCIPTEKRLGLTIHEDVDDTAQYANVNFSGSFLQLDVTIKRNKNIDRLDYCFMLSYIGRQFLTREQGKIKHLINIFNRLT